jgi:hypothetical protein
VVLRNCEQNYCVFGLVLIENEKLCDSNSGRQPQGHFGLFKIIFMSLKLDHSIRLFETKISAYGSSRSDKN